LNAIETKIYDSLSQPFSKENVLITRSSDTVSETELLFKNSGFSVLSLPCISFHETSDLEFEHFFLNREDFDIIIFPSAKAASFYLNNTEKIRAEIDYSKVFKCAVGKTTKEYCESRNIKIDLVSRYQTGEDLAELLLARFSDLNNKTIVIPRSDLADETIPTKLRGNGAVVKTFVIYKTVLPDKKIIDESIEKIKGKDIDWIIFTSPSTFRNFLSIVKDYRLERLLNSKFASIGNTTSKEIIKHGYKATVTAKISSINGIIEEIKKYR